MRPVALLAPLALGPACGHIRLEGELEGGHWQLVGGLQLCEAQVLLCAVQRSALIVRSGAAHCAGLGLRRGEKKILAAWAAGLP